MTIKMEVGAQAAGNFLWILISEMHPNACVFWTCSFVVFFVVQITIGSRLSFLGLHCSSHFVVQITIKKHNKMPLDYQIIA